MYITFHRKIDQNTLFYTKIKGNSQASDYSAHLEGGDGSGGRRSDLRRTPPVRKRKEIREYSFPTHHNSHSSCVQRAEIRVLEKRN